MKSLISVWKEETIIKTGINLLITLILIFLKLEKSTVLYIIETAFKKITLAFYFVSVAGQGNYIPAHLFNLMKPS